MPRHQALYGLSEYRFSRTTLKGEPGPMPSLVQKCISYMAVLNRRPVDEFWALVNYYPLPTDSIARHSDDEPENQRGASIATFSFGDMPRKFRLSRKHPHLSGKYTHRWDLALPNNSCGIMQGPDFQSAYVHEVLPLTKKEQKYAAEHSLDMGRLSITVRARVPDAYSVRNQASLTSKRSA